MISKEKLIKDIRVYADLKGANGEVELANGILKTLSIIKEQPTVYDVDKVIVNLMNSTCVDEEKCYFIPEEALAIVKRGGKDE